MKIYKITITICLILSCTFFTFRTGFSTAGQNFDDYINPNLEDREALSNVSKPTREGLKKIKAIFKEKHWHKLAKLTKYPLKLDFPIPPIKDQVDFLNRFELIFDDVTIAEIANSDFDKDWSKMGYDGFMYKNGQVWLSEQGHLIAVNRNSAALTKAIAASEGQASAMLLFEFRFPLLTVKVHELKNRILQLSIWKEGRDVAGDPDLILKNGKLTKIGGFRFSHNGYFIDVLRSQSGMDADWSASFAVSDSQLNIVFEDSFLSPKDKIRLENKESIYSVVQEREKLTQLTDILGILSFKHNKAVEARLDKKISEILYSRAPSVNIPINAVLKVNLDLPSIVVQVHELPSGNFQLSLWIKNAEMISPNVPAMALSNGKLKQNGLYYFNIGLIRIEVSVNNNNAYWSSYINITSNSPGAEANYFNGFPLTDSIDSQYHDRDDAINVQKLQSLVSLINRLIFRERLDGGDSFIDNFLTSEYHKLNMTKKFYFPKFTIHIEKSEKEGFKYTAWSKGKSLSEEPDIILKNGKLTDDGRYQFKNGKYIYEVRETSTEQSLEAELRVLKGQKVILVDQIKGD